MITVQTSSLQGTHLKSAATVFEHCLFMILLPVAAESAPNLHVCEDHIPSIETGNIM